MRVDKVKSMAHHLDMSGGSWDYFYCQIDEAADRMASNKLPIRRAFGEHLRLVSEAMKAVEWVDSGDWSDGDEKAAIEKVLGKDAKALEIEQIKSDARKMIQQLKQLTS